VLRLRAKGIVQCGHKTIPQLSEDQGTLHGVDQLDQKDRCYDHKHHDGAARREALKQDAGQNAQHGTCNAAVGAEVC